MFMVPLDTPRILVGAFRIPIDHLAIFSKFFEEFEHPHDDPNDPMTTDETDDDPSKFFGFFVVSDENHNFFLSLSIGKATGESKSNSIKMQAMEEDCVAGTKRSRTESEPARTCFVKRGKTSSGRVVMYRKDSLQRDLMHARSMLYDVIIGCWIKQPKTFMFKYIAVSEIVRSAHGDQILCSQNAERHRTQRPRKRTRQL